MGIQQQHKAKQKPSVSLLQSKISQNRLSQRVLPVVPKEAIVADHDRVQEKKKLISQFQIRKQTVKPPSLATTQDRTNTALKKISFPRQISRQSIISDQNVEYGRPQLVLRNSCKNSS